MSKDYPYSTQSSSSSEHRKKTQKVSSRLAKTEQKKVLQQTIIILLAAVVVVLVFLFVILPNVIRLAVNLSEGSLSFEESDTIPPQTPIVSAPSSATTEPTIVISGFGEADSTAQVVLNGAKAGQTQIDSEGAFQIEIGLEQGENTVAVYSVDAAGNESGVTSEYTVVFDNIVPTLELTTPEDGQEFVSKQNQSIPIEGTTEPRAYVFINGRRYRANEEGLFSAQLRLNEGDNEITIKLEDEAGNSQEQILKVTYRE